MPDVALGKDGDVLFGYLDALAKGFERDGIEPNYVRDARALAPAAAEVAALARTGGNGYLSRESAALSVEMFESYLDDYGASISAEECAAVNSVLAELRRALGTAS